MTDVPRGAIVGDALQQNRLIRQLVSGFTAAREVASEQGTDAQTNHEVTHFTANIVSHKSPLSGT